MKYKYIIISNFSFILFFFQNISVIIILEQKALLKA